MNQGTRGPSLELSGRLNPGVAQKPRLGSPDARPYLLPPCVGGMRNQGEKVMLPKGAPNHFTHIQGLLQANHKTACCC